MMDVSKSTFISTKLMPVSSSLVTLEEGTACIGVLEDGILVASPSTGATTDKFVGVAQNRHVAPNFANSVVSTTVPGSAPYTITLAKTPTAATDVNVSIDGTQATQGTVATGVYAVSGNELTFDSSDAGKSVDILFRYALTTIEANLLYGGDLATLNLSPGVNVSICDTGIVYVDNFVISDNWQNDDPIYLGADGQFTKQTGGTVTDAIVAAVPSAADGFLGILLHP